MQAVVGGVVGSLMKVRTMFAPHAMRQHLGLCIAWHKKSVNLYAAGAQSRYGRRSQHFSRLIPKAEAAMSQKSRPRQTVARPVRAAPVSSLVFCIDDYVADCRARNLSERTIAHYARALVLFQECLARGAAWNTTAAVREAVASLRGRPQYGAASLSMYLRAWRSFLRFCRTEELIEVDLARLIKPPRTEPRREVILDADAVQVLLDAASQGYNGLRDSAMLTMMFDTGIRAGEVVALRVRHVDFGARTLTVPSGKTGGRSVPIGRMTAKGLRRWFMAYPRSSEDGAPLFPSSTTGKALTVNSLRLCLKRISDRAGIKTHPHQWRHSFSVNYLRNGGDVFSLQRILGHTTLVMSRWYASLSDQDVQARHAVASPADRLRPSRNR